jgi:acyl-CoA synthetase (AMP-forming)/AMP-acid ligase II
VLVPLADRELDVETVVAHCRHRLADFKVPQYVSIRGEPLPRNPGGKILKRRLRDETAWGEPLR